MRGYGIGKGGEEGRGKYPSDVKTIAMKMIAHATSIHQSRTLSMPDERTDDDRDDD